MSEEVAVSGVVDVGMDGLRIEVIGQIETGQRESNGVLGIDPDVLRNTRVEGKESGEAAGIRYTDILLERVHGGVRKAVADLHHRSDTELQRQLHHAPGEETIGHAGGQIADQVGADDGHWETPEVVIEVVQVAARAAI